MFGKMLTLLKMTTSKLTILWDRNVRIMKLMLITLILAVSVKDDIIRLLICSVVIKIWFCLLFIFRRK